MKKRSRLEGKERKEGGGSSKWIQRALFQFEINVEEIADGLAEFELEDYR